MKRIISISIAFAGLLGLSSAPSAAQEADHQVLQAVMDGTLGSRRTRSSVVLGEGRAGSSRSAKAFRRDSAAESQPKPQENSKKSSQNSDVPSLIGSLGILSFLSGWILLVIGELAGTSLIASLGTTFIWTGLAVALLASILDVLLKEFGNS